MMFYRFIFIFILLLYFYCYNHVIIIILLCYICCYITFIVIKLNFIEKSASEAISPPGVKNTLKWGSKRIETIWELNFGCRRRGVLASFFVKSTPEPFFMIFYNFDVIRNFWCYKILLLWFLYKCFISFMLLCLCCYKIFLC